MVLAVLEAHGGLKLGQYDVYLNVAGGLRIMEPAADLAAAAALISSLTGASLPPRRGLFRRNRAFGLGARGRACGLAAQGGRQAWVCARVCAAVAAGRRRRPNIATQPIDKVAALVALIAASAVETRGDARISARDGVTN